MALAGRHWPLVWALVYLAGFSLGGRLPCSGFRFLHDPDPGTFNMVARLCALLPLLFVLLQRTGRTLVWILILAGGYAAGSVEAVPRQDRVNAVASSAYSVAIPVGWEGIATLRITGWPSVSAKGKWRAPARIMATVCRSKTESCRHPEDGEGVTLSGKGAPPWPGSILTGTAEFSPPSGATLAGSFDYRLFLAGRGIQWRGRFLDWKTIGQGDPLSSWGREIFHPLREGLVSRIRGNLPTEEARLAGAVLLGIRDSESRRASRPFADLGLAHLFAVSGLHVGILLGIILLPGKVAGLSPWQRVLPIMLLLPVYVLLTGMPGSVMRAASLGFLAVLGVAVGRPSDTLRLLGLLFWAGTVWDPVQNLDTGLKLSYLAAGGILAVSSLTNGFKISPNRFLGPLYTGLAVSAAAQWFTLPLVAGSFGRLSMLSPLANLLAVPLFGLGVWCVVLSLVLTDIWVTGAEAVGALAWILFRGLAGMAGSVAQISGGFPIGLPAPGIFRVMLWMLLTGWNLVSLERFRSGRLSGRLTLLVVLSSLFGGLSSFGPLAWDLADSHKVRAWQFDVGQGDCTFLVFPDRWSLMIDTGGRFGFAAAPEESPLHRTVLPFLQRNGLHGIDAVILTHGHQDHTGGAEALAEAVRVDSWFVSGRAGRALHSCVDSTRVFAPLAGEVLHRWGKWEVAVIYPPWPLPPETDENDQSLVVVLRHEGADLAVWSGDLELEGEHLMMSSGYAPQDIQVWKAGHHGSNTSGSRALLESFDPEMILISAGVGNGYKHPNHGPYLVDGDTIPILRTDLEGTIRMEWDLQARISLFSGGREVVLARQP